MHNVFRISCHSVSSIQCTDAHFYPYTIKHLYYQHRYSLHIMFTPCHDVFILSLLSIQSCFPQRYLHAISRCGSRPFTFPILISNTGTSYTSPLHSVLSSCQATYTPIVVIIFSTLPSLILQHPPFARCSYSLASFQPLF